MESTNRLFQQAKQATKQIVCDRCGCEFQLTSVKILQDKVQIGSKEFVLVYFVCPDCNAIYKVLLRDGRYNQLKDELTVSQKRYKKASSKGNLELARMLLGSIQRKQQRLEQHVLSLHNKYDGTFTFAASENNGRGHEIIYHEKDMDIGKGEK